MNDQYPDIHKMAKIGSEGVLVLLSESTNAERPGSSPRSIWLAAIEEAFMQAKQKVILSTFASNVNRVQQFANAAQKTNRKLALIGRGMVNVVTVAIERGYLEVPDGMLIHPQEVDSYAPERVAGFMYRKVKESHFPPFPRLSSSNYRDMSICAR